MFLSYRLSLYVPWFTLLMGIYLAADLKLKLPTMKIRAATVRGPDGAFLLGLPFGIIASPCTVPILLSILALAATKDSIFFGAIAMFVYAIGRGLLLLLIGTFTGIIKNLVVLTRWGKYFERAFGSNRQLV